VVVVCSATKRFVRCTRSAIWLLPITILNDLFSCRHMCDIDQWSDDITLLALMYISSPILVEQLLDMQPSSRLLPRDGVDRHSTRPATVSFWAVDAQSLPPRDVVPPTSRLRLSWIKYSLDSSAFSVYTRRISDDTRTLSVFVMG